jgi:electron transport complex protein RnfC
MVIKKGKLKKGYQFKNFRGAPVADVVRLETAPQIVIPLNQGNGETLTPLVKTEDRVKAGQIIARDDSSCGSPIHASVSGEIVETKKITFMGEKKVPALVIRPDDNREESILDGCSREWQNLSRNKIEELLYLSGTAGLGNGGIPTSYNSSIIGPDDVKEIIIHNTESDLWEPLLPALLGDTTGLEKPAGDDGDGESRLDHFVEGIGIVAKLFPEAGVHLVFNKQHTELLDDIARKLQSGFDRDRVNLCAVGPKYPLGMEPLLVQTALQKPFPHEYKAINMGVVILDVQAVLLAFDAVTAGRSVTERTVALAGPGFTENVHVRVKVGTSLLDIIKQYGARSGTDEEKYRYIRNSALRGEQIDDIEAPLDRRILTIVALREAVEGEPLAFALPGFRKDSISNTFFSLFTPFKKNIDTNLRGEKRACINCGFCVEVCPAEILPNLIHRHVERGMITETLVRFGIFSCIDCNLCTYVCTSKISLAALIKEGKEKLREEGFTQEQKMIREFDLKGVEQ